ncbi:MAG: PKD domain-containing protein [Candidatus Altiarchaeota archaeon]
MLPMWNSKSSFLLLFFYFNLIQNVSAQTVEELGNLTLRLLCLWFSIFPAILTLMFTVSGVLLITGDIKTRAKGKNLMLNSIIAFIILIFLAGILTLTSNSFGISDILLCMAGGNPPRYPGETTIARNIAPIADARVGLQITPKPNEKTIIVSTGVKIYFDASQSRDLDGFIKKYEWDFDDGTSGDKVMETHIYSKEGSYNVELKVTDNMGKSSKNFVRVIVVKNSTSP